MISFIAQRIAKAIVVLLALVVLNFFLIRMAPGDPALVMAGEAGAGDQVFLAQLREKFGLDQPLPVQLFLYVKGILSLDLGFSFRQQMPVATLILQRLPATLLLTGTAFAISLAFGILFGALAARFAGTWADTAITVAALIFYATPLFWVALMAILLFSVAMDWLPSFGYETVGANYTGFAHVLDVAAHLVLPATTIGLFFMATYARMTRASMLAVLSSDFVRTARASGLKPITVIVAYAFRNALLPVITTLGMVFSFLLGANVLVEKVFAWPGIGSFAVEALIAADFAPVQGFVLTMAVLYVLLNLLIDVLYGWIDPRVRIEA